MDNKKITTADGAASVLRDIYERRGYTRWKTSRFEEYDLYAGNRSFITGSSILAFTDTDGRLMALKPDVTLSLIKNLPESESLTKVYYHESVCRAPDPMAGFREINQMGLECIGELDLYTVAEVAALAARSLAAIDDGFILDVSHIDLVSGCLLDAGAPESALEGLLACAAAKNAHDGERLAKDAGLSPEDVSSFIKLITLRGPLPEAIRELCELKLGHRALLAVEELASLAHVLKGGGLDSIYLEPSLMGDPGYYNGVLLKGFIPGVPTAVLSGGRYDGLVNKLGKRSGAMGFAVCLDALERPGGGERPRVDVLVIDDGAAPAEEIFALTELLSAGGESVRVDKRVPEDIVAGRVVYAGRGRA